MHNAPHQAGETALLSSHFSGQRRLVSERVFEAIRRALEGGGESGLA